MACPSFLSAVCGMSLTLGREGEREKQARAPSELHLVSEHYILSGRQSADSPSTEALHCLISVYCTVEKLIRGQTLSNQGRN